MTKDLRSVLPAETRCPVCGAADLIIPPELGVKALEWRDGYKDRRCKIVQAGSMSIYQVRTLDGVTWLDIDDRETIYPTIAEAKAAAQADYEARILSALTTPPAQAVGVPADLIEDLRLGAVGIRTWMPETLPANEQGQVHFARVLAEAAAESIEAILPALTTPPAQAVGVAAKPVGYASEYGLNALASRSHHDLLSVSKKPENEFIVPIYASLTPPVADLKAENERKPLDMNITKEWFEKRAAAEGDLEIGAGRRTMTVNLTPDEIAELEKLLPRSAEVAALKAENERLRELAQRARAIISVKVYPTWHFEAAAALKGGAE